MRLKTRYLMIIGAILALLPHLGIPVFWKGMFITILGLSVVGIAYFILRSFKHLRSKIQSHDEPTPVFEQKEQ